VKLTSSRWVNRILVALIILTALVFALQLADHLWSRKYDAEEAKQQEEREQRITRTAQWIKAEPPDKSFSVLMPRRPTLLTNYLRTPSGNVPTIQLGSIDRGRPSEAEIYIAAFTEFPTNADLSDKEAVYNNAHAMFADKLGRIRRERLVTLQGIAGRETEVELHNGTNLMVARAYITGRRLYQLTAAVPLSRGPTTNTWRFLDSLRLNTNSAQRQ
jgi:hypothetical protein